jgi:hypothetical protein
VPALAGDLRSRTAEAVLRLLGNTRGDRHGEDITSVAADGVAANVFFRLDRDAPALSRRTWGPSTSCPPRVYDEPQTLPCAISSICPVGPDGVHADTSAMVCVIALSLSLRCFGDTVFRCDHQTGDRSSILQRNAHDLGRIDDAAFTWICAQRPYSHCH